MLLVLRGFPRRAYLFTLLGLFTLVALWAAWEPLHPEDWALENALVVVALAVLIGTYRVLPLSRVSYTLIFLFMCLHEVGSHYTYAEVPYDAWWQALTGSTFNGMVGWDRNHYDRLVHFSYGLLLAYPIREVVLRIGELKGFWGYFLPLDVTMSTSMLYELIEWAAAVYFGGELGMAYLGTQGDPWDAHKDMLLASIGAALAMGLTAALNARWQRDFAREWVDSLKVKSRKPLGEDEFARLKRDAGH
jgi:putative membrane protein